MVPVSRVKVDRAGSNLLRRGDQYIRAGFTLVDILVTIAVVGVLIAIMLPSLASVKETAHQVVCRSNVRQFGFAFDMYAEANKNHIPSTVTVPSLQDMTHDTSSETLTLRFEAGSQALALLTWDGLGRLYEGEYLPAPKVFYCPSHKGSNYYRRFAAAWNTTDQAIVGNFQYRGRGPTRVTLGGQPRMSDRLDLIQNSAALVSDGIRTQADFNHLVGANLLRADLSVDWFADTSRSVIEDLPKDGMPATATVIQSVWLRFDLGTDR